MGVINKLKYRTKHELVYDEIRRSLVNADFAPGERLVITYLAKDLGVSESPIREALKRLISENFVVEQGINLYAAPLSVQQFLDMLDIRLQLETLAIRRSARYIDESGVEKLKKDVKKMKDTLQEKNLVEYGHLHKKFHNDCFVFCNVPYLISALIEASDHHERGINIFQLRHWRVNPDIEQHDRILNAMQIHDEDGAVRELTKNRQRAFEFYAEQLKEKGAFAPRSQ